MNPVNLVGSWSGEIQFETNGFNYTPEIGSNRIALVAITAESNTNPVVNVGSVTLGGQTLQAIEDPDGVVLGNPGSSQVIVWLGYIDESQINNMTGNALNILWDTAPNHPDGGETTVYAGTYEKVNQITPISDSNSNTSNGQSSIQAGDVAVGLDDRNIYAAMIGRLTSHTSDAGYTELVDISTQTYTTAVAQRDATTSATVNPTATWTGNQRSAIISAVVDAVLDISASSDLFIGGHPSGIFSIMHSVDLYMHSCETHQKSSNLFTKSENAVYHVGLWERETNFETNGFNYTPESGSNRLAFIAISAESDSNPLTSINSVTLGGQTMHGIESPSGVINGFAGQGHQILWFGYINDSEIEDMIGNTLLVSWNQTPTHPDSGETIIQAGTYENINQITPIVDSISGTAVGVDSIQVGNVIAGSGDRAIYFAHIGRPNMGVVHASGYTQSAGIGAYATEPTYTTVCGERGLVTPATLNPLVTWDLTQRQVMVSIVLDFVGESINTSSDLFIEGLSEATGVNSSGDLFIEGHESLITSGVNIYYKEIFQSIAPSSKNTWEENDISAYLPEGDDLTAEIVIANSNNVNQDYSVGVRGFGSVLDRRFNLYDVVSLITDGEYNTATMHVQVSGGKIELYAPSGVEFFLVGCWVGTKYIETFDIFSPVTTNTWTNKDLSSAGVPSGAIVELMSMQSWGGLLMGCRSIGSTDNRYIRMNAGSTSNQRYNIWTSFIKTSGTNATIQYYLEGVIGTNKFSTIGYWETPPGDYIDVFQSDEANPTINNTWEEVDVSGVTSGSVCSFAMNNGDNVDSRVLGIRESGSSLERKIHARKPNSVSYKSITCMHVNIQSPIEAFSEDATGVNDDFTLIGYWDNIVSTELITTVDLFILGSSDGFLPISDQTDLFVLGKTVLSSSGDLFIRGHESSNTSGDLFAEGHRITTASSNLFIGGKVTILSSVDLYISGNEIIDSSGDLFTTGVDTSLSSDDLFIEGHDSSVDSVDLYVPGLDVLSTSVDLFIGSKDIIQSSIDLYMNSKDSIDASGDLFVQGVDTSTTSGDLFIQGSVTIPASGDLYTIAHETISSSVDLFLKVLVLSSGINTSGDLFIQGQDTIDTSGDLFIKGSLTSLASGNLYILAHAITDLSGDLFIHGTDTATTSVDLFVHGGVIIQTSGDLFTTGKNNTVSSGDLFIFGTSGVNGLNTSTNLFVGGIDTISLSGDLFIEGVESIDTSGDLYVYGLEALSVSGDLFVEGSPPFVVLTISGDLFIHGAESSVLSGDLYVFGHEDSTESVDLYINSHIITSGDISLFMLVPTPVSDQVDLFLKVIDGVVTISGSTVLFINGFEPRPALVCPALDPTASIQIKALLIQTYQDLIDDVIDQLGKNVLLEFNPTRDPCPNCLFDAIRNRSTGVYKIGGPRPFVRGRQCPYCKGRGFIETEVTKSIKCLTKWNPEDARTFGISVEQGKDIVRLKTYLTEADSLVRAKTIVVNHDIVGQMKMRVRLIKGPIPVGLREDRYCITFWELI